jgi:hypothetical protein
MSRSGASWNDGARPTTSGRGGSGLATLRQPGGRRPPAVRREGDRFTLVAELPAEQVGCGLGSRSGLAGEPPARRSDQATQGGGISAGLALRMRSGVQYWVVGDGWTWLPVEPVSGGGDDVVDAAA